LQDGVDLVRVVHGSRDLERLLLQRILRLSQPSSSLRAMTYGDQLTFRTYLTLPISHIQKAPAECVFKFPMDLTKL
jgi:hypothetical protein